MIDTVLARRTLLMATAALALGLATSAALAITPAEVKANGKLIVGIQGDNPPWGFVTSSGKQEGLDADIAELYGKELGVPVEFVALEVNNRIPALTTGRVDLLFATMAMLPERAKVVQFSQPYVANTIVLIGPKSATIKTNEDMGSSRSAWRRARPRTRRSPRTRRPGPRSAASTATRPASRRWSPDRSRRWGAISSTCSASSRPGRASSRTSSNSRTSTTGPAPGSARRR